MPHVRNEQIIREIYSKKVERHREGNKLSRGSHDTSTHEAYGPRDLKLQQLYVYGCDILGYRHSHRYFMAGTLDSYTNHQNCSFRLT